MAKFQRLWCMLGLHGQARGAVWNDPFWFGHCEDCQDPMIRRPGRRWSALPHGYRVVWRAATPRLIAIPPEEILARGAMQASRFGDGETSDA